MKKLNKKRLYRTVLILFGFSLTISLVILALNQNINFFYTPTELKGSSLKDKLVGVQKTIRLGGLVKEGTVKKNNDDLGVSFEVTDVENSIKVYYEGILPDLFREGQGVVVEGTVSPNLHVFASEVLAKHDENYMPPEIYKKLNKNINTIAKTDR